MYLLRCISTGFFEELLVRILVFSTLMFYWSKPDKPEPVWKCIFWASFIFGFLHICNIFRMDVTSVIIQMVIGMMLGILFQSLLIRFHNLFLVAVIHSLVNFNGMLKHYFFSDNLPKIPNKSYGLGDFIPQVVLTIVIIIVSYFLIRKQKVYTALFAV